jgi:predicted RNA-binding Zn ribbon-like protein
MADDLRPSQVAKLTATPPVPAELTDAILDASDAEREAAASELMDSILPFLEQTGRLQPTRSVLDLNHDEFQALASAYALVWRWWAGPGYRQRPISSMLKVIPVDVAESAMRLLRAYGFAPPESVEE